MAATPKPVRKEHKKSATKMRAYTKKITEENPKMSAVNKLRGKDLEKRNKNLLKIGMKRKLK